MDNIISALTIKEVGIEHNDIMCPECNNLSKPYGLGQKTSNKIQLFRKCKFCGKLLWYWIDIKTALMPFSED